MFSTEHCFDKRSTFLEYKHITVFSDYVKQIKWKAKQATCTIKELLGFENYTDLISLPVSFTT
jgi:DNA/RNA-binding domain of Phe-tRNA-synthetase-like protein